MKILISLSALCLIGLGIPTQAQDLTATPDSNQTQSATATDVAPPANHPQPAPHPQPPAPHPQPPAPHPQPPHPHPQPPAPHPQPPHPHPQPGPPHPHPQPGPPHPHPQPGPPHPHPQPGPPHPHPGPHPHPHPGPHPGPGPHPHPVPGPGWHGGHHRPGWDNDWKWHHDWAPYWWYEGIVFPPFYFEPEAPYGYWQCTAFDENQDAFSASGMTEDEAAYNALYDCGGEEYQSYCYIPEGYCQIE